MTVGTRMCACISKGDYVYHCGGRWSDSQLPHIHSLSTSISPCPGMLSIDVISAMLKLMRKEMDLFHHKPRSAS